MHNQINAFYAFVAFYYLFFILAMGSIDLLYYLGFISSDGNPKAAKVARTKTRSVSEFASGLEGIPKFTKTRTKKSKSRK